MKSTRPGPARATVVAQHFATDYLAIGAGRTVLVVVGPAPEWALIFPSSNDFRIVALAVPAPVREACGSVPRTPSGESAFADWLDGVAEGLGLPPFTLLVEPVFGSCARAFLQCCPERATALIVQDPAQPIDLPGSRRSLAPG